MKKLHVAKNPCESCPYRRDVPSGVWHADEYEKLRGYDDNTAFAPFLCHHTPTMHRETACRGWLSVHCESVAVRLAVRDGLVADDEKYAPVTAPLFESGNEAADAGLAEIDSPGLAARRLMAKIFHGRKRRG